MDDVRCDFSGSVTMRYNEGSSQGGTGTQDGTGCEGKGPVQVWSSSGPLPVPAHPWTLSVSVAVSGVRSVLVFACIPGPGYLLKCKYEQLFAK